MKIYYKILNKLDWIINTNLSRLVSKTSKIKVYDFDESLELLINEKCSLTRFGDGEFTLLINDSFLYPRNKSLRFQKTNVILQRRLNEILADRDIASYNLCVAIPYTIYAYDQDLLTKEACDFWNYYLKELRFIITKKLRKDYIYIDALISRFYMDFKDKSIVNIEHKVKRLKMLWDKENILFIEGASSRLGINNDLFDNSNNIQRILCPNQDAFDRYEEILSAALEFGKNKLIILALGPSATVLAYDLAKQGYRALDLGHIDIEYSWFLMNAKEKVPIRGKLMTEVLTPNKEDKDQISNNVLAMYEKQVICSIS